MTTRLAFATPPRLMQGHDYFDFSETFTPGTEALSRGTYETPAWHERKLYMLADRLMLRDHLTKVIEAEPAVECDDVAYARKNNNDLLKELRRLRRYSIKSAIHDDGGWQWSIHDSLTYEASLLGAVPGDSKIFMNQWPPEMTMIAFANRARDDEDYLVYPEVGTSRTERPDYTDMGLLVCMDKKGELYADTLGAIPYATLYKQAGKPQNYEALRQYLLQKFFDLTVPIEIVQEVNADTATMLGALSTTSESTEPKHLLTDMLLPRIRFLKRFRTAGEFECLADTLEPRPNISEHSPSPKPERQIGAYPRPLPKGYKASRKALELARKLGIELGPHETLVKEHKRGVAAKGTVVYKAKDRKKN